MADRDVQGSAGQSARASAPRLTALATGTTRPRSPAMLANPAGISVAKSETDHELGSARRAGERYPRYLPCSWPPWTLHNAYDRVAKRVGVRPKPGSELCGVEEGITRQPPQGPGNPRPLRHATAEGRRTVGGRGVNPQARRDASPPAGAGRRRSGDRRRRQCARSGGLHRGAGAGPANEHRGGGRLRALWRHGRVTSGATKRSIALTGRADVVEVGKTIQDHRRVANPLRRATPTVTWSFPC